MRTPELLNDAFGTIQELVESTLDGLHADALGFRPDPDANSIGWLVWHLTRVEDDHVAGVAEVPQVYVTGAFAEGFAFPFDLGDIGYGHSSEQVGRVRVADPSLLVDYQRSVAAAAQAYVSSLGDDDLDRVVDRNYDPPVTAGVRLLSVVSDCLQHLGQAAYVRGLADRR